MSASNASAISVKQREWTTDDERAKVMAKLVAARRARGIPDDGNGKTYFEKPEPTMENLIDQVTTGRTRARLRLALQNQQDDS